jgi:hypothetical protein
VTSTFDTRGAGLPGGRTRHGALVCRIMPAPATTRRTPCAALPRLLALRADVRVAAPSRSGKGNSNSSHQRPPGAAQVCVVRAWCVCARAPAAGAGA